MNAICNFEILELSDCHNNVMMAQKYKYSLTISASFFDSTRTVKIDYRIVRLSIINNDARSGVDPLTVNLRHRHV